MNDIRAHVSGQSAKIEVPHTVDRAHVRRVLAQAVRWVGARFGTHRLVHLVDRKIETIQIVPVSSPARGTSQAFYRKALNLIRPRIAPRRLN